MDYLSKIEEQTKRIAELEAELKEKDSEWIEFANEVELAIGSQVLGHRGFEEGFIPDHIKQIHKFYTDQLRVLEERCKALEMQCATYKRIASIKKPKKDKSEYDPMDDSRTSVSAVAINTTPKGRTK